MLLVGHLHNNPDAYRERTALLRINELDANVLIIHGELDENVSIEQAKLLENALREHDKDYETWYFPKYTHYIPPVKNAEVVRDLCDWMRRQGK